MAEKGVPQHVAIILDGNGRWAKKRGLPRIMGHAKGIKTLVEISETARNLGLNAIVVYAFSTENWNRPTDEVAFLMNALIENLARYKERIIKNHIRVRILGERTNLSQKVLDAINEIESATFSQTEFNLCICFNYGGRQEILHAARVLAKKVADKEMSVDDITLDALDEQMYTSCIGPIDLMIRTSGEERLSNFLPWQLTYSEFIFTKTYWPDFHKLEFYKCLYEFQNRHRRFGGLDEKDEQK